MLRFLLPFFVFIIFIGESTFVDLLHAKSFGIDRIFAPRFLMVILILISSYIGRTQAVYYGISFGLLFDIIYTDIIGVYMFLFPLIAYIMSYIVTILHMNLFVILLSSIIGITLLELSVFGLYSLIGVSDLLWSTFVTDRLFPTIILNGVFAILIFYPFRKLLLKIKKLQNIES